MSDEWPFTFPRAEAEKAIAAVLAEHRDETEDVLQDCHCTCGTKICPNGGGMSHNWHFRAHVASVLADLMADGSHDHGLICRPEETLTCGLCGETYLICKVCHADVYGHHQKCRGRADTEGDR